MTPLSKKLRLKPGMKTKIMDPPAGYTDALGQEPEVGESNLDVVQLFAKDSAELAALWPAAHKAVNYDGLIWIAYPKKSSGIASDLGRDEGWAPIFDFGLRVVSICAVDEVWSAVRFRPVEKVRSKV